MGTEIQHHETTTTLVTAPPMHLNAGSDMIFKVKVACAAGCALDSETVHLLDQDGNLVAELKSFNELNEVVIPAPVKPGEYTWTAVFPEHSAKDILHQTSSVSFSFVVMPHQTSMTVWDVPSPVEIGSKFTIKAGVICAAGCKLTGRQIRVSDAAGESISTAVLSTEPWSDAGPLYWAEIELEAPKRQGVYNWSVRFADPPPESLAPDAFEHRESDFAISFATALPSDHVIKLQVVDKVARTPVFGADVGLFPEKGFPYRTRTDEAGVATLNVAKGNYEIFIGLMDYDPFRMTTAVESDVTLQAEFVYHPDLGG